MEIGNGWDACNPQLSAAAPPVLRRNIPSSPFSHLLVCFYHSREYAIGLQGGIDFLSAIRMPGLEDLGFNFIVVNDEDGPCFKGYDPKGFSNGASMLILPLGLQLMLLGAWFAMH